jgi:hypothetical protein
MVKVFWTGCLLVCFAACGALVINCTATDRATAINLAKTACVVIDNVPSNSALYVFIRPAGDAGVE